MFRTGDKVYCKVIGQNLVVAYKEGENTTVCIDVFYGTQKTKRFCTYMLYNHDLELGWNTDKKIKKK